MNQKFYSKSSENIDFHSTAYSEKANFINFVYSLGNEKMRNLFKFPGEDFSLWWLSLIAEKSTIKSDAYKNLISYLCFDDGKSIAKRKGMKNNLLLNFGYGFWTLCIYLSQVIIVWLKVPNFKKRKARLCTDDYVIVSYFPYIDAKQLAENKFINKYLEVFHKTLQSSASKKFSHICIPVDIGGFRFSDSMRLCNKFQKGESLFLLHEFFNFGDLLLSIYYYLYFSVIFVFNLGWIKKQLKYPYKGNNFYIWDLFKSDFYRSFAGDNLAAAVLSILSFRKLISSINSKAKIITICEMQWWEKALYLNARKRGITTIGYQHSQVPALLFNHFNAPEELQEDTIFKHLPLPDYIATVGTITKQLFCEFGWPQERIIVWGAQRFEAFRNLDFLVVPWQEKEQYIVCALALDAWETKKIVRLLQEAFSSFPGYKIILKSHPVVNLEKIIKELGNNFNPKTFFVTSDSLDNLMKKAKAMIVTKSSASFYALAFGSYIVVPRFPRTLDCNPLSYVTDFLIYSYSAQELRSICDRIIYSEKGPSFYEQGKNFLREYFYFPNSDLEYLTKIENLKM